MIKFKDNIEVDGSILAEESSNPKGVVTNSKMLNELNNKVNVVEGKNLSTNDFTDEYISKINALESGYKGVIRISDATPTEIGQYTPVDDGTYPNGLTYTKSTDELTLFIFNGDSWVKVSNLGSNVNDIATLWQPKEYQKSQRVLNDDGEIFTAMKNTTPSENIESEAFFKNAYVKDNVYFIKGKYLT